MRQLFVVVEAGSEDGKLTSDDEFEAPVQAEAAAQRSDFNLLRHNMLGLGIAAL